MQDGDMKICHDLKLESMIPNDSTYRELNLPHVSNLITPLIGEIFRKACSSTANSMFVLYKSAYDFWRSSASFILFVIKSTTVIVSSIMSNQYIGDIHLPYSALKYVIPIVD